MRELANGSRHEIFIPGATGALGVQLVPRLVAGGHGVVGMTRTTATPERLRAMGARPVAAEVWG